MWSSILAGIAAIPRFIAVAEKLLKWFERMDRARWDEKASKIEERLSQIEKRQELLNAAKEIQDLSRDT